MRFKAVTAARNLSMLRSQLNPITGKSEWIVKEEADINEEVARSHYADMLHDAERNSLYHQAIKCALAALAVRVEPPTVLDIGTGTGLLAMMAARSSACRVFAAEVFEPMALVAKRIIDANGLAKAIDVLKKRSTAITVGPDGDMPCRADLVVMEIFDSELIGEGVLPTMAHAHRCLLKPGGAVVPAQATVHAQLVQSDWLWHCHKLNRHVLQDVNKLCLQLPPQSLTCSGAPSVYDLHTERLWENGQISLLSSPTCVKQFDFDDHACMEQACQDGSHCSTVVVDITERGEIHALVTWWNLLLHRHSSIRLSTAPVWTRLEKNRRQQWREHWLQSVHYLPEPLSVRQGDQVKIDCYHDDYRIWFKVFFIKTEHSGDGQFIPTVEKNSSEQKEGPVCECGVHMVCSRSRLAQLNHQLTWTAFSQALSKLNQEKSTYLFLGEPSILPLLLPLIHPHAEVFILLGSSSRFSQRVMQELVVCHDMTAKIRLLQKNVSELERKDLNGQQVDVVLAEPHLSAAVLPWDNLFFWHWMSSLNHLLAPACTVLPERATLCVMGVEFEDLWKLRAPVGTVEGFDLSFFDAITQKWKSADSDGWFDADLEAFHLWEFQCSSASEQQNVLQMNLQQPVPVAPIHSTVTLKISRKCNGLVLWLDYHLDQTTVITTGLCQKRTNPANLQWAQHCKQAVIFFPDESFDRSKSDQHLTLRFIYQTNTGHLKVAYRQHTQDK